MIIAHLCDVGVMQGEKAILCEMGLDFGTTRKPFEDIPADKKRKFLDKVMPLL